MCYMRSAEIFWSGEGDFFCPHKTHGKATPFAVHLLESHGKAIPLSCTF
jgi:hypothetical protein